MAKKNITFFLISFVFLLILFYVVPVSAQIVSNAPTNQGGVNLGAPVTSSEPAPSSFGAYTNRIYQLAVVIGISLAILMIIFAGYKYMGSAGDPQSLAEAKEVLVGAIVGLILILLTRLILATIDPRLLKFPDRAPDINSSTQDTTKK